MKYEVIAICVRDGHALVSGIKNADAAGRIVEVIDTDMNRLFAECDGPWSIEDCYEAFWNRLNPYWETNFPKGKERVKVLAVRRIEEPASVGAVATPVDEPTPDPSRIKVEG